MTQTPSLGPDCGPLSLAGSGLQLLQPDLEALPLELPLFLERVTAGFPSPAQDHIEERLNLNSLVILRPEATYFLQVRGHSMIDAGILDGDIVVVDRSIMAGHGHVIVAEINGQFTIKKLWKQRGQVRLDAANPKYPSIELAEGETLTVFGVVTWVIHRMHRQG